MAQLRTLFANMTPRGRMLLGGSVVGTLILTVLLMQMAGAPAFQQVAAGLDPADTGKVTAALDEKGVAYNIINNGTAVEVQQDQVADARIALAEKGLPGQTQPGFELFDKQKLGSSDFQQQVTYQRALEGELARTVMQVGGVAGAQVQLVLPKEELFASEESPAKAAVLLSGSSDLDPGAVRGIAQLVSSSVEGLKDENVTITDGSGSVLWPQQGGGDVTSATAKQAAEARYAQQLEASIGAMLLQSLGPDKAVVKVAADLNADRATRDQLVYGKKAVPLSAERESEGLEGGAGGGAGASGAGANIPSYAAAGAGGGRSNYERRANKTEWAVDKTVTRTEIAPGRVNRLNVALMVDRSIPRAELAGLRDAVAAAAGIDAERGDVLKVTSVDFAKPPAVPAPKASPIEPYAGYAKWGALGLGLAGFLFFITRHLRRREQEELADPVWLRELVTPRPLAALEAAGAAPADPRLLEDPTIGRVREAATAQPDRVAQQVRAWMHEE